MLDDVHHERSLSHRRTCSDDEHIGGLQAVDHLVQLAVTSGHSRDSSVAGKKFLKVNHDFADSGFYIHFLGGLASFADLEDFLLHAIEELLHVFRVIVSRRNGLGARLDDIAQNELFLDDGEVRIEVRSSRSVGVNLGDCGRPANAIEKVPIHEVLRQGDQFDGFAGFKVLDQDLK